MGTFITKPGSESIQYNGYYIVHDQINVYIFEEIAEGKFKKRREIFGALDKKSKGDPFRFPYKYMAVADKIEKAKNFIDEFIKPIKK